MLRHILPNTASAVIIFSMVDAIGNIILAASQLPQAGHRGQLRSIQGSPPSLIEVPAGCRFAARCALATPDCSAWQTELLDTDGPGHRARCWRHNEMGRAQEWQASGSA